MKGVATLTNLHRITIEFCSPSQLYEGFQSILDLNPLSKTLFTAVTNVFMHPKSSGKPISHNLLSTKGQVDKVRDKLMNIKVEETKNRAKKSIPITRINVPWIPCWNLLFLYLATLCFFVLRPLHTAQTANCLIQPLSDLYVASCLTRSAQKLHWTHHQPSDFAYWIGAGTSLRLLRLPT